jgi:hypothetical protein
MPSIDAYTFVAWKGYLLPAKQLVGLVEPAPSVDGYGLAIGAWRADPVDIVTVAYVTSVAQAEALRENLRALQTQAVQVIDQFGVFWQDVVVMSAVSTYSFSLVPLPMRFETTWRLLVTSDPPDGLES